MAHKYDELVPESVKLAMQDFQFHRVMSQMTGLPDFSIAKVAEYLGGMSAVRQQRYRTIRDGLMALQNLR